MSGETEECHIVYRVQFFRCSSQFSLWHSPEHTRQVLVRFCWILCVCVCWPVVLKAIFVNPEPREPSWHLDAREQWFDAEVWPESVNPDSWLAKGDIPHVELHGGPLFSTGIYCMYHQWMDFSCQLEFTSLVLIMRSYKPSIILIANLLHEWGKIMWNYVCMPLPKHCVHLFYSTEILKGQVAGGKRL